MARFNENDITPIFDAVTIWKERSLLKGKSVFTGWGAGSGGAQGQTLD